MGGLDKRSTKCPSLHLWKSPQCLDYSSCSAVPQYNSSSPPDCSQNEFLQLKWRNKRISILTTRKMVIHFYNLLKLASPPHSHLDISVIQITTAKVEASECPQNFEVALSAAGFGRFNVFVIATCCVCCISAMTQTTTMSLIFPSAQCDLNLSLDDKGALNAATYIGMILSAVFWGFLADVKGRRKIMVYGHLVTFFFDVLCGLSQSFWMMAFAKFCGGFM